MAKEDKKIVYTELTSADSPYFLPENSEENANNRSQSPPSSPSIKYLNNNKRESAEVSLLTTSPNDSYKIDSILNDDYSISNSMKEYTKSHGSDWRDKKRDDKKKQKDLFYKRTSLNAYVDVDHRTSCPACSDFWKTLKMPHFYRMSIQGPKSKEDETSIDIKSTIEVDCSVPDELSSFWQKFRSIDPNMDLMNYSIVFKPTSGRCHIGLIGIEHMVDFTSQSTNSPKIVQILVVEPDEFDQYVYYWGKQYIVICLPQSGRNCAYSRFWIVQMCIGKVKYITMVDDSISSYEIPMVDGTYKEYRLDSFDFSALTDENLEKRWSKYSFVSTGGRYYEESLKVFPGSQGSKSKIQDGRPDEKYRFRRISLSEAINSSIRFISKLEDINFFKTHPVAFIGLFKSRGYVSKFPFKFSYASSHITINISLIEKYGLQYLDDLHFAEDMAICGMAYRKGLSSIVLNWVVQEKRQFSQGGSSNVVTAVQHGNSTPDTNSSSNSKHGSHKMKTISSKITTTSSTSSHASDSETDNSPSTTSKRKNCKYCGKSITASNLRRHEDKDCQDRPQM